MPSVICCLCLVCLLVQPGRGDEVRLASGGRALAVVVVPENCNAAEGLAADNLVGYLQRMTAARFEIRSELRGGGAGFQIHVGATIAARQWLPADAAAQPERVLIRRIPEGLLLCGGGASGTQQAVWRFLELLGCRWLTPSPADELVPRSPELVLPANFRDVDTAPAFDWRLFRGVTPERAAWGEKMGFNGFFPPEHADRYPGSIFWPERAVGVHNFNQIIPLKDYVASHPEWFALLKGERPRSVADTPRQLCLTAPGLVEEFTYRTQQFLNDRPGTTVMSISPEDGYGWCECAACRQLDQRLGGGRRAELVVGRSEPVVSDRLFWFCNQVAAKLEVSHPTVSLVVLAYVNYVEPPLTVRPAKNIVPFVCHYWPADHSRAIADPNSPANRRFHDILRRWAELCPQMMLYSYTGFSAWWRLPRPILRATAADIRLCRQLGIRRFYCQDVMEDWELNGPLHYVLGRLLSAPDADPDECMDEWLAGMFGTAAGAMRRHYELVERSVRKTGEGFFDDPRHQVPGLYDPVLLREARGALREAAAVAETGESRDRISRVAAVFERGYWLIRILEEKANRGQFADIWVQGLLWLWAVVCLLRAARSDRQEVTAGRRGTPTFLLVAAIVCVVFWLNSLVDVRSWLIDLGRQVVQDQDWYSSRLARKLVFTGVALLVTLAAVALVYRLIHGSWRLNMRILLALCLLLGFEFLRATSFDRADGCSWLDQVDVSFRVFTSGLGLQWLVSLAVLVLCLRPRSRIQRGSLGLA